MKRLTRHLNTAVVQVCEGYYLSPPYCEVWVHGCNSMCWHRGNQEKAWFLLAIRRGKIEE